MLHVIHNQSCYVTITVSFLWRLTSYKHHFLILRLAVLFVRDILFRFASLSVMVSGTKRNRRAIFHLWRRTRKKETRKSFNSQMKRTAEHSQSPTRRCCQWHHWQNHRPKLKYRLTQSPTYKQIPQKPLIQRRRMERRRVVSFASARKNSWKKVCWEKKILLTVYSYIFNIP